MKSSFFSILFGLGLLVVNGQEESPSIILMIGDGTGLSQITAGMYANNNQTHLESFTNIGLAKTHASNSLVTDSAASGTAIACGEKTLNGVVGINPKNQNLKSILEICEENGYVTGLIATSSIVHATPASFYANVSTRNKYQDIALHLRNSEVDYFIGGGLKHFINRKDKRNLKKEMSSFEFVDNMNEFNSSSSKKIGYFTSFDEPKRISEGRKPALDEATKGMLDQLTANQCPFFLMIEGSQIDWGGHGNDKNYVINEFLDFNQAIGVAVDYVNNHPNTLLIVTADHETGGLGIPFGKIKNFKPDVEFVTKGHTASMVPVFAMGKGAEMFGGIYENTAIFKKMKSTVK